MQDDYNHIISELGDDNQAFAGKTVLLAGSQGFLGRLYQEYFLNLNKTVLKDKPVQVICIDRFIEGSDSIIRGPYFTYMSVDIIENTDFLMTWLKTYFSGLDYIINLAGLASPKAYSTYPLETIRVSVQGTDNLLRLARDLKVSAYMGFSSSEIYGDPDVVPTPESYLGRVEIYSERACYDYGKLILEVLCDIYHKRHGVNTKVVRPFNVIGYCANDGRVLPNSVAKLLRGDSLSIYLPGTQTRTFCWFSDFIVGSIKVLLHGDNMPYNIGNSDNEVSMLDLARRLEKLSYHSSGKSGQVVLVQPSEVYRTEPMRRCPDISRARGLGYEPKVSLDEALARFWGWAKESYPTS